jgi:hypothetical protein
MRVLTKRGLMIQLEEKVQTMDIGVKGFSAKLKLYRRNASLV